ncbi:capsular polysaccharide biosynthesis protein [Nonlabens ulvanivorans]|nr:capsular polysaccharide biosynthesis protein [Nonlabens ulvanivorans]
MPLQLFDNILRWQGFPIQEAKSHFKQLLSNTDESIEQRKKQLYNTI